MATVLFKRGDSATITSTPVTDGQILFDTSGNGKMYLDNGTDRLEMGGAVTVDASLSKTSTNAVQNKAVTGNILNSLEEVSAATQQNTIAGALALKKVNSNLGGLVFAQDASGNWGYKIGGADPVVPFKGEPGFDYEHNISIPYVVAGGNPNVLHYYTMTKKDAEYSYLALFAVTAGSVVSIELSNASGSSFVYNKPGGNYSFALIANPVLNGKVNFRHAGTGDGHVFKLMIK